MHSRSDRPEFKCGSSCAVFATVLALLTMPVTTSPVQAQQAGSDAVVVERINELISQTWDDNEVTPSAPASDGEFARRVSLDIVGRIPSLDELTEFLADDSPDRKQKFVDRLLDDDDYIRHWTTLWANRLVGRGGNRGGRRDVLERWLRNAFYRNLPYDRMVYELVSASGPASENGAVGFLASHLNEGAVPATSITSRLFLGMQVQCTQCHNHPFNDWKQSQFWSMNAFFRGTRLSRGMERGQFGLEDQPVTGVIFFEKRSGLLEATTRRFVDGTGADTRAETAPRVQLAELITDPAKPYMARTEVNRMWGHLFGYGFTKPVDDMGPHNPVSHPELLDFLSDEFRKSGYDLKRLIRWMTATRAYQLSSGYGENNTVDNPDAGDAPLFSRMYLKRFTAEQLYDSLLVATDAHRAGRGGEAAETQRATWLRQFVQTFGTDENDESTTFNGTIPQALVLMNGQLMQNALSGADGSFLRRVLDSPTGRPQAKSASDRRKSKRVRRQKSAKSRRRGIPAKIETLFLVALAREPREEELERIDSVFQEHGSRDPISGLQDVFWALLNSNEFIINH